MAFTNACDIRYSGPSGAAAQLLRRRRMDFQPLEKQLAAPSLLVTDYTKMESPAVVWAAFQALDDFEVRKKPSKCFMWRATQNSERTGRRVPRTSASASATSVMGEVTDGRVSNRARANSCALHLSSTHTLFFLSCLLAFFLWVAHCTYRAHTLFLLAFFRWRTVAFLPPKTMSLNSGEQWRPASGRRLGIRA